MGCYYLPQLFWATLKGEGDMGISLSRNWDMYLYFFIFILKILVSLQIRRNWQRKLQTKKYDIQDLPNISLRIISVQHVVEMKVRSIDKLKRTNLDGRWGLMIINKYQNNNQYRLHRSSFFSCSRQKGWLVLKTLTSSIEPLINLS